MKMKMKKYKIGDVCLDIFVYAFLISLTLIMLLPFMNVISKAFSGEWAIVSGRVRFLPVDFQLDTIKYVISQKAFLNSFTISVFVTVLGTVCNVFMSVLAAYPLSKRHLPGMKQIMLLFVFTMVFNAGMIPNYMLIRDLKLLNNLAVLIIPSLITVYNMMLIKNYFEGLPESVEESARIDGASNLTILFKIVLPMATPVLATVALFYAVSHWDNYMTALMYITKQDLKPLQLYMRDIILEAEAANEMLPDEAMNISGESVRSATIVASVVPILLVYPFLQKYFIKGITIGSVKG